MAYISHIKNVSGQVIFQSVKEHSEGSARYAANLLEPFGLKNTAYAAALIHDLGKATLNFSNYITKSFNGESPAKIIHSYHAVIFLLEKRNSLPVGREYEPKKLVLELMACAAGSHHGLFDTNGIYEEDNGFLRRLNTDKKELCYDEAVKNFFSDVISEHEFDRLLDESAKEFKAFIPKLKNAADNDKQNMKFLIGMLTRLIISAVIYGDRCDTIEFMTGSKPKNLKADSSFWAKQSKCLEEKLSSFSADTPINKARRFISDSCKNFISDNRGIYKISVPTGSGKTLSMLRFALDKAQKHNKKRIIFIIPLLSVLEQNSEVIKCSLKNPEAVLEHHSNILKTNMTEDTLDKYELLTETWDSPIIISTLVQFLNTLFTSKTSDVWRMQSLCESVIVIDEAQDVPLKMINLFNMAINFISYVCGSIVVLSTATLPCFDDVKRKMLLSPNADIVPYDSKLWAVFKRTDIKYDKGLSFKNEQALADFAAEYFFGKNSLLIICNTKASALNTYTSLKAHNTGAHMFHLSTNMCMAHRKAVFARMTEMLSSGKKVICVSTQLIEAGMDISFEAVIRAKAGLDNVVQSAGRNNRNNENPFGGELIIVTLLNENLSFLNEIADAQKAFDRFIEDFHEKPDYYGDILSPKSLDRYFAVLLNGQDLNYPVKNMTKPTLYELLSDASVGSKHKNLLLNQAFKTAGDKFAVFDENTTDVIVPYNHEAKEIIKELYALNEFDLRSLRGLLNKAKQYTIHIFQGQKTVLEDNAMLSSCAGGRIYILNEAAFSAETGLCDIKNQVLLE